MEKVFRSLEWDYTLWGRQLTKSDGGFNSKFFWLADRRRRHKVLEEILPDKNIWLYCCLSELNSKQFNRTSRAILPECGKANKQIKCPHTQGEWSQEMRYMRPFWASEDITNFRAFQELGFIAASAPRGWVARKNTEVGEYLLPYCSIDYYRMQWKLTQSNIANLLRV